MASFLLKVASGGSPILILFVIVMEGMSNLINTGKDKNWNRGFLVGDLSNMEITHLQYADDILVFCEAAHEQIKILRVISVIFEALLWLHINWGKSFVYPINTVNAIEGLANILGEKVGELPTIYLCTPMRAKNKSKEI